MLFRAANLQTMMARYLVDRMLARQNIDVVYGVAVEEVHGEGSVAIYSAHRCPCRV